MLALATHARRTVLLRATPSRLLLDVRWASTATAASEPVKRPRGRPPKVPEPVKRPRGRPPNVVESAEPAHRPVARPRGRPPKVKPSQPSETVESVEPEPVELDEAVEAVELVEAAEPVEPAEPVESVESVESVEPSDPNEPSEPVRRPLGRPRGRPPKAKPGEPSAPVKRASTRSTKTSGSGKLVKAAKASTSGKSTTSGERGEVITVKRQATVWTAGNAGLAAKDDTSTNASDDTEPIEPFTPMEYFETDHEPATPKRKVKVSKASAEDARNPVNPDAEGEELKKELERDGSWSASRRQKKHANLDLYRVNLISDKLCTDTLKYIGPTLKRHEGCDLLDIFPGTGVWSKRLHEVLKPRSHILMEPDVEFYKPYLEPLLEKPGTQLLPESGIVWEQLNKVLNPSVLPHQVERKYAPEETPERNDTLLVTMNMAMFPRRKFRSFDSLAQLVIFQILSSIRPGALFQKYGLVRMLIWAEDSDARPILPRTIQARKKLALEAEISTDWVCQLVSPDSPRPTSLGVGRWYLRSEALNLESTRRALLRMQEQKFKLIRGREPEHVREFFESLDTDKSAGPEDQFKAKGRPGEAELVQLQENWDNGTIKDGSKEHKRLRHLLHLQTFDARRAVVTENLIRDHDAIVRDYNKAGDNEKKQQKVLARAKAWTETVHKFEKKTRNELILLRDNRLIVKQDKPILAWDRRYIEPLRAEPEEFFPAVPCSLLDIQPKAVPSILREIGPSSSRGGDMFELILRGLVQRSLDPIDGVLNTISPGAGDWIVPNCKMLHDPKLGGHIPGLLWPSLRTLTTDHLVEITEQWMKWPFRPSYEQLVSRTIEEADAEPGDDAQSAAKIPMDI